MDVVLQLHTRLDTRRFPKLHTRLDKVYVELVYHFDHRTMEKLQSKVTALQILHNFATNPCTKNVKYFNIYLIICFFFPI